MTCIVKKKHHLKVLFKEMQFVAFFIFHMEKKTRMQVKNDMRCFRQINAPSFVVVVVHNVQNLLVNVQKTLGQS